ncbi:hypothetical protein N2152v2_001990 [Parachlorella kessleri]
MPDQCLQAQFRSRTGSPRLSARRCALSLTPPDSAPVVEEISSLQNNLVKHCVRVRQNSKYREEEGTVIISGADLVSEVAQCASVEVLFVVQGSLVPDLPAQRVVHVTPAVMQKLTGLESVSPSTLAAEVAIPSPADFCGGWRPGQLRRLLVLDRLQDPGNLGTLLRTALALGWGGVLLLPGCCDPYNDKALRAGRGAAFRLPLASGTLEDVRRIAPKHGLTCLAAEPHGVASGQPAGPSQAPLSRQPEQQEEQHGEVQQQPPPGGQSATAVGGGEFESWLWDESEEAAGNGSSAGQGRQREQPAQQAQQGVCLALGSEGQGLSEELLGLCTPVAIPQLGDMESLNVAAAGAILMFALSDAAAQLAAALEGAGALAPQQLAPRAQRARQPASSGGQRAQQAAGRKPRRQQQQPEQRREWQQKGRQRRGGGEERKEGVGSGEMPPRRGREATRAGSGGRTGSNGRAWEGR